MSRMNTIVSMLDVHVLDIGSREGFTDYIDFIREDELTHPIMKGCDKYGRYFVVVKFIVSVETKNKKKEIRKFVQTFFQRYTGSRCWMGARVFNCHEIISTVGGINEKQINFLEEILNFEQFKTPKAGALSYEKGLKFNDLKIYENTVYIDGRIPKAVKKIENNWYICRYTPCYKMCGDILMKNIESVYKELN